MNHRNNFTGQQIESRDYNDNAPARYSAPSAKFKEILAGYANRYCSRCGGTGYLGVFKHFCAGRCFKCIPENVFEQAEEEFNQTCETRTVGEEMSEIYLAVCGDDGAYPAYLSDGMWITHDGQIYDAAHGMGQISEGLHSSLRSACLSA
jgi:hypothetical protein